MSQDADAVAQLLEPTCTTPERIEGLLATGLTEKHIAQACGVSTNLVKRWRRGASVPHHTQFQRLDDLRTLCLFAIEVSGHNLELAAGLLVMLKAPALVVEGRYHEADQALLILQKRAFKLVT
jgi:transcriptional regulator with XRE-family HTH domain